MLFRENLNKHLHNSPAHMDVFLFQPCHGVNVRRLPGQDHGIVKDVRSVLAAIRLWHSTPLVGQHGGIVKYIKRVLTATVVPEDVWSSSLRGTWVAACTANL